MIAIRQIQEVKSGAVTVALPVDFHAKQVEIIVLPMERKRLLIDTSILIDHLRKTQKDTTIFYQLAS